MWPYDTITNYGPAMAEHAVTVDAGSTDGARATVDGRTPPGTASARPATTAASSTAQSSSLHLHLERLFTAHCPYEKMHHGEAARRDKNKTRTKKKKAGSATSKPQQRGGAGGTGSGANASSSKDDWVATEKVHGANFAFVSDGQRVLCANRKTMLDADGQDFMGCFRTGLVKRHEPLVLDLVRRLRAKLHSETQPQKQQQQHRQQATATSAAFKQRRQPRADVVWVFGELFGGGFPGHTPPEGTVIVQHGIFYSPVRRWVGGRQQRKNESAVGVAVTFAAIIPSFVAVIAAVVGIRSH